MRVVFTEWNPMAVVQMAKNASRINLEKASKLLIERIRASMREGKTGKTYNIGWFNNVASAEGETPAIMTGKLYSALEYKISEEGGELISRIGVNVDGTENGYAVYLELGTSKMGERSYLRRTLFQNEEEIRSILSG